MAEAPPPRDLRPLAVVADDSETLREGLARVLLGLGLGTLQLADGAAALAAARRLLPKILLLELVLPGCDGRDILAALKADARTRDIRVIVMTRRSDPYTREVCLDLGADDFIEKPADIEFVRRRVQRALRRVPALPAQMRIA